ncbi:hypothetical protein [Pontibacterium sp.]|uniref:hypothetical protein n=1 Tax=Pontibacterium sp. TaxID=2036026 RepID=UPI003518BD73
MQFQMPSRPLILGLTTLPLLLGGCATSAFAPAPKINTVILANNTETTIHDVTIRVEAFGGKFYCGTIPPQTQCSTRFPAREYEANPVTVSWQQQGVSHETAPFTVPTAEQLSETPLAARLTVMPGKQVDAQLEPQ